MDSSFEKEVGARIRAFREIRGLTQENLSAQLQVNDCDITRSALAKIEVGQRHLYLDELKLICKLLNITYSDLLD